MIGIPINLRGGFVHVNEMTLPRACAGRCNSASDLSPEVRSHLSEAAQKVFIARYNSTFDETNDSSKAEQAAWETIHQQFDEDENGI
jgi:cation transport regulator ChaB